MVSRNVSLKCIFIIAATLLGATYVFILTNHSVVYHKRNHFKLGRKTNPVVRNLREEIKKQIEQNKEKYHFNNYKTHLIGAKRLRDVRYAWCKNPRRYPMNLPSTSVIIPFYNEYQTVLLRTVNSILNNSPPELIKEIILIDDYSQVATAGYKEDEYFAKYDIYIAKFADYLSRFKNSSNPFDTNSELYEKVKIVRIKYRVGLMQAKNLGAKLAKGSVLTFMEAHIECAPGWLEPLITGVARNPTLVAAAINGFLNHRTFKYTKHSAKIAGFFWNLKSYYEEIPRRIIRRRKHPAHSFQSPLIKGGVYSLARQFFETLGHFDEGMKYYGGDDIELSFKVWMCGGSVKIYPCSHVAHMWKPKTAYKTGLHIQRNLARVAEVWMDGYAKNYFKRIGSIDGGFGDVSAMKKLRAKLQCKSFKWYLKNVYPELIDTEDELIAEGTIASGGKGCLHISDLNGKRNIDLKFCDTKNSSLVWMVTKRGEIRYETECLEWNGKRLTVKRCGRRHSDGQYWKYDLGSKLIKSSIGRCLGANSKLEASFVKCDPGDIYQKWTLQLYNVKEI